MGAHAQSVLALAPLTTLFAMNVRRAHAVPDWMAFLCGLLLDALTNQPLGFWALIHLVVYGLAALAHQQSTRRLLSRWLAYVCVLAVTTALMWLVESLLILSAKPWQPLLQAATVAVIAYPLVDALMSAVVALPMRRDSHLHASRG